MRGNIGNLLKQAQAMQANMQKAQAELANVEVTGQSGGGMVKVTMNGKHQVRALDIEPQLLADDREMLEDMLIAAINDAVQRIESAVSEKMSGMMAGLNLPPGFKPPF
ncbi:MAG: YbaB/EbfC family nucleoid-associated protein [Steroidobacteraceae bacterium]